MQKVEVSAAGRSSVFPAARASTVIVMTKHDCFKCDTRKGNEIVLKFLQVQDVSLFRCAQPESKSAARAKKGGS